MKASRPFYPALDGLRAVAFLMVFCNHYLYMPWGWAGVDLFFVLSGFLITGILFDSQNDPQRMRHFYIRRTLRIFPLYYGVMLLLLPFTFHSLSRAFLAWPAYVGNFAWFVPRWDMTSVGPFVVDGSVHGYTAPLYLGHFWSLCVEEQFYIFWPWVVFWVRDRKKLLAICLASLPVCLGLRILGEHLLPSQDLAHEILYRATPFRMDAILIGGALALLMRGPIPHRLLMLSRHLAPIIIVALCVAMPIRGWGLAFRYPEWRFTWGLAAIDCFSALIILVSIQEGSLVCRALSIRPLRWLGRLTYGAYIFHGIPVVIYRRAAMLLYPKHAIIFSAMIGLACTILLSWVSYTCFESRFTRSRIGLS